MASTIKIDSHVAGEDSIMQRLADKFLGTYKKSRKTVEFVNDDDFAEAVGYLKGIDFGKLSFTFSSNYYGNAVGVPAKRYILEESKRNEDLKKAISRKINETANPPKYMVSKGVIFRDIKLEDDEDTSFDIEILDLYAALQSGGKFFTIIRYQLTDNETGERSTNKSTLDEFAEVYGDYIVKGSVMRESYYVANTYMHPEDKITITKLKNSIDSYPINTYLKYATKGSINNISNTVYGLLKVGEDKWAPYSSILGVSSFGILSGYALMNQIMKSGAKNIAVKLPDKQGF